MTKSVLAIDLGATSGRVIEGFVAPGSLRYEVIHRFSNGPVSKGNELHWNASGLFAEALEGMAAVGRSASEVVSVGIDAWAVDYALLRQGQILWEPFHYRDERNARAVAAVHGKRTHADLFRTNGLQFLSINTLYQLSAENWGGEAGTAEAFLLIPDLMAYWLTGQQVMEITNASTTGLLDVSSGKLDAELIALSGAPPGIFAPLVEAGVTVASFAPAVAKAVGFSSPVVTVGSHDTASAVVAAPLSGPSSAYISCGTWGLVGMEIGRPILSDAARKANFTNERGVDGRIRFLTNVMGLWLLNESVSSWREAGDTRTLESLVAQAGEYTGPRPVFDVSDPMFMAPGGMPERISAWFRDRSENAPTDPVGMMACIIESLAVAFAHAVRMAGTLSSTDVTDISLVGGGSLNAVLCQRLADRAGVPVVAGPVEATALGNILVQARAAGLVEGDLESLRSLVRLSSNLVTYEPRIAAGSHHD